MKGCRLGEEILNKGVSKGGSYRGKLEGSLGPH